MYPYLLLLQWSCHPIQVMSRHFSISVTASLNIVTVATDAPIVNGCLGTRISTMKYVTPYKLYEGHQPQSRSDRLAGDLSVSREQAKGLVTLL
jgi:hypothetical protein